MITANQKPEQLAHDQIDNPASWREGWQVQSKKPINLTAGVVRTLSGINRLRNPYDKTVDKNFQDWIFKKQEGTTRYTIEQLQWLRIIKDYIAKSFYVERDDFEHYPFNKQRGLGKMRQLFGEDTHSIIFELNENRVT